MSKTQTLLMLFILVVVLSFIYFAPPAPVNRGWRKPLARDIPAQPLSANQQMRTARQNSSSSQLEVVDQDDRLADSDEFSFQPVTCGDDIIVQLTNAYACLTPSPSRQSSNNRVQGVNAASSARDISAEQSASQSARKSSVFAQPIEEPSGKDVSSVSPDPEPYFLWRQLQIHDNDTLAINLLLCENPANPNPGGAIVGQVIPLGWEVASTYPQINASDKQKREIKWLFANILPGTEQKLQIILRLINQEEKNTLALNSTFYRCRLPSGETAQFSCQNVE